MPIRIRACVIRVVKQDNSWSGRKPVLDLLPWADPYIAQLIRRLETHYGPAAAGGEFDPFFSDDSCDPYSADDACWREDALDSDAFDDGWREDAFMPPPIDALRKTWPAPISDGSPIFGGFPLLEDLD